MTIDVGFLPQFISGRDLSQSAAVVFDVLRATTSITSALRAGVLSIRIFPTPDAAQAAAAFAVPRPILCGEIHAVPPPGFDLGNSPRQFTSEHAGKTVYLATTNGTRALLAVKSAAAIFAGALVNASAVAMAAANTRRDVLLLCSGTEGQISQEDLLGAGAVCEALLKLGRYTFSSDAARVALRLYQGAKGNLAAILRDGQGGRNIIAAGLEPDIDFSAHVDMINIVGVATEESDGMIIRRLI
jgi:2-phosphosulfolactate phosphatase